jgi:hypothetical protein
MVTLLPWERPICQFLLLEQDTRSAYFLDIAMVRAGGVVVFGIATHLSVIIHNIVLKHPIALLHVSYIPPLSIKLRDWDCKNNFEHLFSELPNIYLSWNTELGSELYGQRMIYLRLKFI